MAATLSETKELLRDLIAFRSISSDSNLDIIRYLATRLETAGARVEILPDASGQKANLWATLGPDTGDGLVLSGHTDVVPVADQPWSTDPFTLREADGRLYGRGTCDMKGFIAVCIALASEFANLTRPVHFAFTHDEEVGCTGAQALTQLLSKRAHRPAMALIGEPTQMRIVEAHKGVCEYTVTFTGAEGHGSAPDAGLNAVECAARYMGHLIGLRATLDARAPMDSPFTPPGTTINIGALNGGSAHNIIAGRAELKWEMRPVTAADMVFVKDEMTRFTDQVLLPEMRARHPGAGIETQVIGEVVGLAPSPDNPLRDLLARLTGQNETRAEAYGTEAGLFQQIGIEAVLCGPGSIAQAHRPDEFVTLDQLSQCIDLLRALARSPALRSLS